MPDSNKFLFYPLDRHSQGQRMSNCSHSYEASAVAS